MQSFNVLIIWAMSFLLIHKKQSFKNLDVIKTSMDTRRIFKLTYI